MRNGGSRRPSAVILAAATLAAAFLAGCGGSSPPGAGFAAQQRSQALRALTTALSGAGVPPSQVQKAVQGSHACPAADRGADVGTASFDLGPGNHISVTQDACPVIELLVGHPELSYRGPGGCRGQFFTGDGTTADPAGGLVDWFRYGAHDAYLIALGQQVYHFVSAPRIVHGRLVFDQEFDRQRIVVTVSCPPPRPSRWLLPPSA